MDNKYTSFRGVYFGIEPNASNAMFKNYFTVALRNFRNQRLYSLINVLGLSVGLACGSLIYLYVNHEMRYDTFHSKADRIFRINEFFDGENGAGERSASIPFPMAEALKIDYNNMVEEVVRLYNFQSPMLTVSYEPEEKVFNERNFFFADPTFGRIFDLCMIAGTLETGLNNPNSVILSASAARRYFGTEQALGKSLLFQNQVEMMVTGVFKDIPDYAHFHPDFLGSFSTLKFFYGGDYPQNWHWNPCWTYLLLKTGIGPQALEARLPAFVDKHLPESFKDEVTLRLQALTDIHLTSHLEFEIEPNGSKTDIYIFSGIAVFVLLIACMNFINLSTAQSARRGKEVGMRKAIGASRHQIMSQFVIESVMIGSLAVMVSILIVLLVLPYFNNLSGKQLVFDVLNPRLIGTMFFAGLVVACLSSIYPALILSSFEAVKVLKSNKVEGKGLSFRQVLVAFQFAISTGLIIVTGVVIKQVNFLQGSSPGFTKDHIVMVPVIRTAIAPHYRTFVEEALQQSSIAAITAVEEIVGAKHQGGDYAFEGMDRSKLFPRLKIRHGFTKTFNIPLLAGRDYNIDNPADDTLSVVVNETLVRGFRWTPDEAIGRFCQIGRFRTQIIGVVKDFNFTSKHQPVAPLVLQLNNSPKAFDLNLKYMAVRIKPGTTKQSLATLEALWQKFLPGRPFEYFFLDNALNAMYKSEGNLIKVSAAFSMLAVGVACLGLFGLASFHAEQRKREVSIRKVLGSSTHGVVFLMLSHYVKLLLVAVALASLFAWLAMHQWLAGYAYRIDMPLSVFLMASLLVASVAMLTVGYKSYAIARVNPVQSLRSE